jgi:hypothetical protein
VPAKATSDRSSSALNDTRFAEYPLAGGGDDEVAGLRHKRLEVSKHLDGVLCVNLGLAVAYKVAAPARNAATVHLVWSDRISV